MSADIWAAYLLAQLPFAFVPQSPRFKIPDHLRAKFRAISDETEALRVEWVCEIPNMT